jgi:hypothetical protein
MKVKRVSRTGGPLPALLTTKRRKQGASIAVAHKQHGGADPSKHIYLLPPAT